MQSESSKKAVKKYLAKLDEIKVRVPKGKKDVYKALADAENISLNQLIVGLLEGELLKHPDLLPAQEERIDITSLGLSPHTVIDLKRHGIDFLDEYLHYPNPEIFHHATIKEMKKFST